MRDLERLFRPRSVAVVGASESRAQSRNSITALSEADVELFLVNPRRPTVFGRRSYSSLADVGRPVDAVLALVNPDATLEVVGAALELGCGGMVLNADGFDSGQVDAILAAAGTRLALLGPNCNGYVDAVRGIRLSGAPPLPLQGGSIGVVTHSGGLIATIGAAGDARQVGFSHLISTGNEIQVGMADCIDFLIDDPNTHAIGLIIESVRDPQAFFAALVRAHHVGKPVVAVKLGRSEQASAIARSHTGAVTGQDWVYRAALRQHGVVLAADIAELVDRLVCFDQLDRTKWSAVESLAILGPSGGWAALASDVAEEEGLTIRPLNEVGAIVENLIHVGNVANPLDMSGGVVNDPTTLGAVINAYAESPDVDALLALWFLDEAGNDMGGAFLEAAVDVGWRLPVMVASIEDASIGETAQRLPSRGVALGRGLRGAMRALSTMGTFVRERDMAIGTPAKETQRAPAPGASEVVSSSAGRMLSFAAAMRLLESCGIDVAPYTLVRPEDDPNRVLLPRGANRFVVKLADVPHRTDIGAVELGASAQDVGGAVMRMRALAAARSLPATVVVQAQLHIDGEVLLSIDTTSQLGPFVACGPGGALVELGQRPSGALAPISPAYAWKLLDGFADTGAFEGIRGGQAWDRQQLSEAVASLSRLAIDAEDWIETLEINPLAVVGDRLVAVDCLCLLRVPPGASAS